MLKQSTNPRANKKKKKAAEKAVSEETKTVDVDETNILWQIISNGNKVCCDNKGALYTFAKKSKRVPSGAKNADIQRVLQLIEQQNVDCVVYDGFILTLFF